jgi:hypothetical protein
MVRMVTSSTEDFDALHERVLQFMGAFAATQFAIDTVIGFYLARRMPELGPELAKQFLRRIRDDQRLPLFKAFAAQANYGSDLSHFDTIYRRAKQLRDMVGHSHSVVGPVYSADNPPCVGVARTSTARFDLVPESLFPSTFTRFTADCEWISQHVYRAGYAAEPQMFVDHQGNPTEPTIPAVLPEGGEPFA